MSLPASALALQNFLSSTTVLGLEILLPGFLFAAMAQSKPNVVPSIKGLIADCCLPKPKSDEAWVRFQRHFGDFIALTAIRTLETGEGKNPAPEQIADICQDVYLKLIQRDKKALRDFVGLHEHSILKFLSVITVRTTLNSMRAESALVRRFVGLPAWMSRAATELYLPLSAQSDSSAELALHLLKQDCLDCLRKHCHGPDAARDIAIFKLYFFERYTAVAIAEKLDSAELTQQVVEGVIAKTRKTLRDSLFDENF